MIYLCEGNKSGSLHSQCTTAARNMHITTAQENQGKDNETTNQAPMPPSLPVSIVGAEAVLQQEYKQHSLVQKEQAKSTECGSASAAAKQPPNKP